MPTLMMMTRLLVVDDDTKDPVIDPERDEALNILADLVDLSAASEDGEHHKTLTGIPLWHESAVWVKMTSPFWLRVT